MAKIISRYFTRKTQGPIPKDHLIKKYLDKLKIFNILYYLLKR